MDNITHSLAGWALGQAGLKTQTRKGLAVLLQEGSGDTIRVAAEGGQLVFRQG